MSRGPGTSMRGVLESVEAAAIDDEGVPVWCTPPQYPRSERESLRRAARILAERGQVERGYRLVDGRREFVVRRVLTADECRVDLARLERRVEKVMAVAARSGREVEIAALFGDDFDKIAEYRTRLSVETSDPQHLPPP